MIDARASRPRKAIQNFGSRWGMWGTGRIKHALIWAARRHGNYIVRSGETIFKFYLCNGRTSIVSFAERRFIVAPPLALPLSHSAAEGEGHDRRFRFRSHGSTSGCHGRIAEAQQPKLLGVGMILYRRYLGITVETSSSRWLTPEPISRTGHRRARKNGPSPPCRPLLCHH